MTRVRALACALVVIVGCDEPARKPAADPCVALRASATAAVEAVIARDGETGPLQEAEATQDRALDDLTAQRTGWSKRFDGATTCDAIAAAWRWDELPEEVRLAYPAVHAIVETKPEPSSRAHARWCERLGAAWRDAARPADEAWSQLIGAAEASAAEAREAARADSAWRVAIVAWRDTLARGGVPVVAALEPSSDAREAAKTAVIAYRDACAE